MNHPRALPALFPLFVAIAVLSTLPAAEPSGKPSEFPAFTKAGKTAGLVFAIATAKEIELISLDPVRRYDKDQKEASTFPAFHNYTILGTARLTDSKDILRLAESLGTAIDEGKSSALCFSPRHAIRIARPDGPLDIVVCFQCRSIELHGFTGFSHSVIATEPAQKIWESIFTAYLPKKP